MNRKQTLEKLLDLARGGTGVLIVSGNDDDRIPSYHAISTRDGSRLKAGTEVRHVGFGLFIGGAPSGTEFCFDGGGALQRSDEPYGEGQISWTPLTAKSGSNGEQAAEMYASMGYNFEEVVAGLEDLLAAES